MKLSTTSDSRPLMITLRHSLIADATPRSADTVSATKPSSRSSFSAGAACAPPNNMGTRMPCGGTEVITAAST